MRNLASRLTTSAMIAGALLFLSACGKSEKAPETDTNLIGTNASADLLENGTASDITATDATIGAEGNMAVDNETTDNAAEGNGSAPGNSG